MPLVGFEPTIPVFEQTKTVHDLHRPATVIGGSDTTSPPNVKFYLCLTN
jgi:hypothetical protein